MIQENDRRRYPRVPIPEGAPEVQVILVGDTGACGVRRVRALDLSRMGMSFRENTPINVGSRCTILINHRRQPVRIVGRVLSCQPGPEGGHVIRVKFLSISPISSEDLAVPLCDDPAVERLLVDPSDR